MDTLFQKSYRAFAEAVVGTSLTWFLAAVCFLLFLILGYFVYKTLTDPSENAGGIRGFWKSENRGKTALTT